MESPYESIWHLDTHVVMFRIINPIFGLTAFMSKSMCFLRSRKVGVPTSSPEKWPINPESTGWCWTTHPQHIPHLRRPNHSKTATPMLARYHQTIQHDTTKLPPSKVLLQLLCNPPAPCTWCSVAQPSTISSDFHFYRGSKAWGQFFFCTPSFSDILKCWIKLCVFLGCFYGPIPFLLLMDMWLLVSIPYIHSMMLIAFFGYWMVV
jgi:hypothetical protein